MKGKIIYLLQLGLWISQFGLCLAPVKAQITYPRSVVFGSSRQLTLIPVTELPAPGGVTYQSPQPQVDMGYHASDIMRQQNTRQIGPIIPPSDPLLAHQFIINQYQQTKQQQQLADLQAILSENLPPVRQKADSLYLVKTKIYREAFAELMKMNAGQQPFSLKRAVFIIENAFMNKRLSYSQYSRQIADKVRLLKVLMKKEKITAANSLGKNYLIQKLFSEQITEYRDTSVWKVHKPFQYDFNDFFGEKDWTKMFVTKLLRTGKGQCHSLPLLYLIFAEEIGANAWLSLAPEHSYIIFCDNARKTFFNFETTNGNPVSYDWIMESGYISSAAIKSKVYLDTLGRGGLIAGCIADLVMGYIERFGYDVFMVSMIDQLLQLYPKSLQGQILRADVIAVRLNQAARSHRLTSPEQFPDYPEVYNLYVSLKQQYELIDALGYAHMPKEKYQSWLLSLNNERHRAEKQKLKKTIVGDAKADN